MNTTTRREALKRITWFSIAMSLDRANAEGDSENLWAQDHSSNFKAIYGNERTKSAFLDFLKNIYSLYPEDQFHQLIDRATQAGQTDKEIYEKVQSQISTITPYFWELRYALPAMRKERDEMARQTFEMLGKIKSVDGYMEVGTTGRYMSKLQPKLELKGDVVLLNSVEPSYSLADMAERGQPMKSGRFVSLNNYQPITAKDVADSSLDLVVNYSGFHHSPLDLRDGFVQSILRVLRPGGRMLLREHDVTSPELNHMAGLAHDVSNLGRGVPWSVNQQEVRNFTSSVELAPYLEKLGFKFSVDQGQLLQAGDPTRNALLEFVKT